MKTSIITIGDEILIGQVLDTNSQWMASHLHTLGAELMESVSISDTKEAIVNGLNHALSFADLVIVTGGLGPTKDDVTKYTLVDYFQDELVLNVNVLNFIKEMFDKRGIPFSELNKNQAMLPKTATVLPNKLGTASGMWFEKNGKIVVSLPGVPYEMKGLMLDEVLPRLRKIGGFPYQAYQTYVLYGLGESSAAEMLEVFEDGLPNHIKLAYLPAPGRLRLRLTGKSFDKANLDQTITNLGVELLSVFQGYSIETGDLNYVDWLKQYFVNEGKTLSIAESCTGGKIASEITAENGVSSFFLGGVVAYNAGLKQSILKVSKETIENHSVVSKEVAKEMVLGVQKLTESDYAIATTGNAGPTADETDETVGIVYIAIASKTSLLVERFNFGQPREKVIEQSKNKAFELLVKEILKNH
ncbi:CinA family nicotinamide mononucleotide deamidase-related protein [Wenyingzhuangia sp. 2_MG-2023]|uniref:CinA family nicotinamide mononucleotide deamidase-related protein n=1 Tax=Wenyingzhuangia sp. 2_MG-2023 TaxID=3062639 RepID=UPI0026E2EB71|nr:CinA family nicotinamide mononucleotide deamidase-related protein [Wenyingzhuangia sp. 2_MG-2023]MDO6739049.1 CinA family nicotinamide mononucleotide deamidase-related protein [Wenyingzhuangia sp. 2_MG-2023]